MTGHIDQIYYLGHHELWVRGPTNMAYPFLIPHRILIEFPPNKTIPHILTVRGKGHRREIGQDIGSNLATQVRIVCILITVDSIRWIIVSGLRERNTRMTGRRGAVGHASMLHSPFLR